MVSEIIDEFGKIVRDASTNLRPVTAKAIHSYFRPLYKESTTCKHVYCMHMYNDSQHLCTVYHKNSGPCFLSVRAFIQDTITPRLSEDEFLEWSVSESEGSDTVIENYLIAHSKDPIIDAFATAASTDITICRIPYAFRELIRIANHSSTMDTYCMVESRKVKRKAESQRPPKWQKKLRAQPTVDAK